MNKKDLIKAVAAASDLSNKDAEKAINAFIATVTDELKKENGKVQLVGFGTFEVRNRKAKDGRNPRTGEDIRIPASRLPAFRAGQALKDAVK